jgi:hypothetical protein
MACRLITRGISPLRLGKNFTWSFYQKPAAGEVPTNPLMFFLRIKNRNLKLQKRIPVVRGLALNEAKRMVNANQMNKNFV